MKFNILSTTISCTNKTEINYVQIFILFLSIYLSFIFITYVFMLIVKKNWTYDIINILYENKFKHVLKLLL